MTTGARRAVWVDDKLCLPLDERERRWKRLRLGMALRGLDALIVYGFEGDRFDGTMANLAYVTGLRGRGFCLFPMENDPIAFIGTQNKFDPFNYYEVVQDWIKEVRSADAGLKGGGLPGVVGAVKQMGLERGRIGLVDGHEKAESCMPYKTYEQLRAALPDAKFTDETALLTELRLIKSKTEIALLERAGQLAHEMLKAMAATARPGVREVEVWTEMMRAHMLGGGDPHSFILLASGPVNEASHMFHGKSPPYCPTQRILAQGDVVLVEFHAAYGGYLAAAEKTVVLGEPGPDFRHLHDVAVASYRNGLGKMRPGVPFNVAVEAYQEPVLAAGMRWLELGLHQHGLSSAGFPTAVYPPDRTKYLPLRRSDGQPANISSFEFQPGMVFGQNIDINDPNWRPNIGVMLGDTIVIEETGPRPLCGTSLDLVVV